MVAAAAVKNELALAQRRVAPRRRGLLSGMIVHSSTLFSTPCAILDISLSGARIRLSPTEPLGEPIYLIDFSHGLAFEANVAWRREDRIGLRFTTYFDLSKTDNGGPTLLRRLWIDRLSR
jgi:hypothetical protein